MTNTARLDEDEHSKSDPAEPLAATPALALVDDAEGPATNVFRVIGLKAEFEQRVAARSTSSLSSPATGEDGSDAA